jgi:catechol 2,3-dioxygenase-like lactoylglutathione lyase family enzyme
MSLDLHHVHLFASNIDATIEWWCRHMCAKVLFDNELAGARNVFLAIGTGRLHIYDQAPRDRGHGAIHHLGIKVGNLRDVWRGLRAQGITSPNGLREQDGWRYVMISAPDGVLLELFEFDDPSAPANVSG